jgi:hypothetical protein
MASITCITHQPIISNSKSLITSQLSSSKLVSSKFLGIRIKRDGCSNSSITSRIGPSNGTRVTCWFKFGKNGVDAEGAGIYGSQSRDDFDRDDVEQVSKLKYTIFYYLFNYLII